MGVMLRKQRFNIQKAPTVANAKLFSVIYCQNAELFLPLLQSSDFCGVDHSSASVAAHSSTSCCDANLPSRPVQLAWRAAAAQQALS
eukprot:3927016-Pleurochrysis_carterae.AAC.1